MKRIDISTPTYPTAFTLVDDEDFEYLNQWKWYPIKQKGTLYCQRSEGRKPNKRSFMLHRVIMKPDKGMMVDHIDGNPLDNRKCNLRICNNSQNMMNARKRRTPGTSKFKGVFFSKRERKFIVHITFNKKVKHIGTFANEIDAALAYNQAALNYHGQFARINQISAAEQAMHEEMDKEREWG